MRRILLLGLFFVIAFFVILAGPDLWLYRQRQEAIRQCQEGDCRAWDSLTQRARR